MTRKKTGVKTPFLKNADLMAAIHESKSTYCAYRDGDLHTAYDAIVLDRSEITPAFIATTVEAKAVRTKLAVSASELVFRVMTCEHIPLGDPEIKRLKRNADGEPIEPVNFPPFIHVMLIDGEFVVVARSHWRGGVENGHFSIDHGRVSARLGKMILLLTSRFAQRANFRSYSWIEEMKALATLHLCTSILRFDESKGCNPFAFVSMCMRNSFLKVLNEERKIRNLRDDITIAAGALPSFARQIEDAEAWAVSNGTGPRALPPLEAKRGRPKR